MLAYQAARVLDSQELLDGGMSERLVVGAAASGGELPNAARNIGDVSSSQGLLAICGERLQKRFERMYEEFTAENEAKCRQEEEAARRLAKRRIAAAQERLRTLESQGKTRLLPMTRGQIAKEERVLEDRLDSIKRRRIVEPTVSEVAKGFIRVVGR